MRNLHRESRVLSLRSWRPCMKAQSFFYTPGMVSFPPDWINLNDHGFLSFCSSGRQGRSNSWLKIFTRSLTLQLLAPKDYGLDGPGIPSSSAEESRPRASRSCLLLTMAASADYTQRKQKFSSVHCETISTRVTVTAKVVTLRLFQLVCSTPDLICYTIWPTCTP